MLFELVQDVWDDPLRVILPIALRGKRTDGTPSTRSVPSLFWSSFTAIPNRTSRIAFGSSAHERAHCMEGNTMSKKVLSPELQDQVDRLVTLPDDQIDTSDIPEALSEAWRHARRPGLYRPIKKTVTLRLDANIVT